MQKLEDTLVSLSNLFVNLESLESSKFWQNSHDPVVVRFQRRFVDDLQFQCLHFRTESLDEFIDGLKILSVFEVSQQTFKHQFKVKLFEIEGVLVIVLGQSG